jgi:hypothetical protein
MAPSLRWAWNAVGRKLAPEVLVSRWVTRRTVIPARVWQENQLNSFGKHPAGNCWLEGGRSSLLESAQEATLLSLSV